ncbi:phosphotransferase family protein [Streptomyces sp. NPDC001982]|uniref:phosphotransferase family protein n=1 Tax=Streptomyces sp. NPDC001982 TaxID=3154405 RepID=UPI00332A0EFF
MAVKPTTAPDSGAPAAVELRGLRLDAVGEWLAAQPSAPLPPYRFEPVSGGRTNLTYRVTGSDGRSVALRRPALDDTGTESTGSAAAREWRISEALAQRGFPVPRPVARCTDPSVTGARFSVVEWVDGRAVGDAEAARRLTASARAVVGEAFVDTLARLHSYEVGELGLADWVRPRSYLQRQLRAWRGPALDGLAASSLPVSRADALAEGLDSAAKLLSAEDPVPVRECVLHGDYRLDNVIVSDTGTVLSVVDWELAAVGDPLADLAYTMVMWEPFDSLGRSAPTSVAGFSSSSALVARYRAAVPFSVDQRQLDLHLAFAAWRAACIGALVLARYEAGATAGSAIDASRADDYITHYLGRFGEHYAAFAEGGTRNKVY